MFPDIFILIVCGCIIFFVLKYSHLFTRYSHYTSKFLKYTSKVFKKIKKENKYLIKKLKKNHIYLNYDFNDTTFILYLEYKKEFLGVHQETSRLEKRVRIENKTEIMHAAKELLEKGRYLSEEYSVN